MRYSAGHICRRVARVALIACAGATLSSAATTAPVERGYDVYLRPGDMVRIAPGRRLNVRCSGAGPVTVLLESGLGFPSYSWRKVQPAVARFARVCSYDRAGLGFSDIGPMPRTAGAIADDLGKLIDAAGLRPPFVVVGSSLGSQSVRLIAFRRPGQIAGMVLVDPYVEGEYAAFAAIDPAIVRENADTLAADRACRTLLLRQKLDAKTAERRGCISAPDPSFSPLLMAVVRRQRLSARSARTVFSESYNLDRRSETDVRRETRSLGDMPLIVLSAGGNFAEYSAGPRRRLLAQQARLYAGLAALSTRGSTEIVADADHVIQASRPAAVIDAIRRVVGSSQRAR